MGDIRLITHEIGHVLGLDDLYTKVNTDPKNLMHKFRGGRLDSKQKSLMFNQYTGAGNVGTKIYRNADKDPIGSGDTKKELNETIEKSHAKIKD